MGLSEIRLLHDGNAMVRGIEEVLSPVVPVRRVNILDGLDTKTGSATGAIVCVSLPTIQSFDLLARTFDIATGEAIFIMPSFSAEYAKALSNLGVKRHLVAPVDPAELIATISGLRNRMIEAQWEELPAPARDALAKSRASFVKAFAAIRDSGHVDIPDVAQACALVADYAKTYTLSDWLAAIRNHHDYTYRHCMSVCGMIVHFAHNIGIGSDDLDLLSVGGMLHDIGKARIPLAILDKPTKLDVDEQEKMREHPAQSRVIMDGMEGLDPRVIRMAVHHHEKLDGSGYPDGLSGAQIDDLVRLTAIADVFSALIDERAYKAAMSFDQAFAIMESMKDHLDLDMLVRFKEFAMDARPKAA
jgi:putative nucleotidyltransferase with HDIG domain